MLAEEPELAQLFGDDAEALESWLASADDLLATYFGMEDPTRLEPAERELLVETTLDSGLVLRGYVDRLDVAPSGEMRVVDYKTGNAPMELYEARALFQMRFYALVLWKLHGRVPSLLKLLYLGSNEVLEYQPDERDLLATERQLEALWAAVSRAVETGDWRPSPSPLCEWCDHQVRCPAFGNEPPPLPTAVDLELSAPPGADCAYHARPGRRRLGVAAATGGQHSGGPVGEARGNLAASQGRRSLAFSRTISSSDASDQ